MRFKDNSIQLNDLMPQLVLALFIVDGVMSKIPIDEEGYAEALITSGNDGKHAFKSLHYSGRAVDLRSRWFTNPTYVLEECKKALGHSVDFDMILESRGRPNEHFHLEYQPKRR